jgi:hypothetical protein
MTTAVHRLEECWLQALGHMKMAAFWDRAPCSVEVNRRFRGAYRLHRQETDTLVDSTIFIYLLTYLFDAQPTWRLIG